MADIKFKGLNQFGIDTAAEAKAVLEDLGLEFMILSKKIRKVFIDAWYGLPELLNKQLRSFRKTVKNAFQLDSWADHAQATVIYGETLADSLYQLQLSFSGLKLAVIQAAAPIVQVLLPVVQLAVRALTGLAQSIGYVLRMLFFRHSRGSGLFCRASGGGKCFQNTEKDPGRL